MILTLVFFSDVGPGDQGQLGQRGRAWAVGGEGADQGAVGGEGGDQGQLGERGRAGIRALQVRLARLRL